jgi:hypothetical protein
VISTACWSDRHKLTGLRNAEGVSQNPRFIGRGGIELRKRLPSGALEGPEVSVESAV